MGLWKRGWGIGMELWREEVGRKERRQELGEQRGSEGTGIGAGLKVILHILARFDYVI